MIDWMINYMKWWVIIVVPFIILTAVWIFIVALKDRMWWCPDTITIQCDKCGEVHALKVIKLLSNDLKGRYVVWCSKKHKFYTLYKDRIPKNNN